MLWASGDEEKRGQMGKGEMQKMTAGVSVDTIPEWTVLVAEDSLSTMQPAFLEYANATFIWFMVERQITSPPSSEVGLFTWALLC